MSEVVDNWFLLKEQNILDRVQAVEHIHKSLITGYTRNFGKYSAKVDTGLIESAFNNVPL
ncbi:hypothetical protein [Psychromonas sp. SR45-3]|uniref:hypothetical protein n=1 Tax=Psychromonas sp. SR45-3 TaxID=2760930 RepID=UPI0015FA5AB3|nr:hypothetical protein [Psychromonas sp. SR45-3]MBB1274601.1 hypothetical protein [Psychromonas sp. SR45-3]